MSSPNNKWREGDTILMASGTVLPSFDGRERWSFVVVDACDYGRLGLVSALKQMTYIEGKKEVFAFSALDIALSLHWPARNSKVTQCLVVRLPPVAREALVMMLQLSELVQNAVVRNFRIVLLSPFANTLMQRLLDVMGMGRLAVIDARLSISLLCREVSVAMKGELPDSGGGHDFSVLSPNERKVLFLSLQNRAIHQQARSRRISPKTVYSQRRGALRRFGVPSILSLLRLLNAKKYRAA